MAQFVASAVIAFVVGLPAGCGSQAAGLDSPGGSTGAGGQAGDGEGGSGPGGTAGANAAGSADSDGATSLEASTASDVATGTDAASDAHTGVDASSDGAGGAGGTSGNGGSGGSGGVSPGGPCAAPVASTATRPQLSNDDAANFTTLKYLAKTGPLTALTTDNWSPTAGLGPASSFTPTFTVAADGSGTHTTVQAALGAVSGSTRQYILIKPGTYREIVTFAGSTPLTLYGADVDATKVVIVNNKSAADTGSTATTSTFTVKSSEFQAMNLTISNDFAAPSSGTGLQAVALYTTGDRIVLQNVRLHGFQDTLYIDSPSATTVARVYIKNSFIEGDTDFIFGRATAVIDGSTINYLSSRKGSSSGIHLAPSTSVGNDFGFLLTGCMLTGDTTAPANKVYLGRSWDQSSTTPTPNGQVVIRESILGGHIAKVAPWTAAATSGRAFSAAGNRLYEYCNSGPGAK